jgi:diaminopimelate decarboxylase
MDFFSYKNGEYFAEDVAISDIAAQIGTPFYCYSTATLVRHVKVLSESLKPLDHMICYAVKANNNLDVIRTIKNAGAGADVVSQGEIIFARKAGIAAKNIVFSGVGKTADEMAYALNEGIFQFNLESEDELEVLQNVAKGKDIKAAIAVRVNPDVIAETHAKISTGHKTSKFGIPMSQARALYGRAAAMPNIHVQGVSMHIGSQLTSLNPFAQAFAKLSEFVTLLNADGHAITTVDIGGGLGIPYGQDEPPLPDAYAKVVKTHISALGCKLIVEPGRLIVGNAGILVTKVIRTKAHEGHHFVIVDAGMNDLIRPAMYHAHHDILPVREPMKNASTESYDIVGPVCESSDIFAERRSLPQIKSDDLLAIRSAGAYGASMACNYNLRPLIAEVIVDGANIKISRARQTYDEMLAAYS